MRLDTLIHDEDVRAPLKLYIYGRDGYHRGGQWFRRKVKYPGEEITLESAKQDAEAAISQGLEVRITNGGDNLVFHAVDGRVIFPACGAAEFWEKAAL